MRNLAGYACLLATIIFFFSGVFLLTGSIVRALGFFSCTIVGCVALAASLYFLQPD